MYRTEQYKRALERAYKDCIVAAYDPVKDVWYTNSKTEPGTLHKIIYRSRYLCDCTGFWRTGMCKHIAIVFETQKKLNHIWICPNCGQVIQCHPTMPVIEFDNHMSGNCTAEVPVNSRER